MFPTYLGHSKFEVGHESAREKIGSRDIQLPDIVFNCSLRIEVGYDYLPIACYEG